MADWGLIYGTDADERRKDSANKQNINAYMAVVNTRLDLKDYRGAIEWVEFTKRYIKSAYGEISNDD